MAIWTNNGLILAAQSGVVATYVGIGTGCGTLASGLTSGTAYTALPLSAGLPAGVSSGQGLTITDGTNTQTVTVATGGAATGAVSIPVNSFTAAATFAATTTGVVPTPQVSDITIYNEIARISANAPVAGSNPGETLNSGYFDGTQASGFYLTVGYFGGSTATSSVNTGTLMIEDVQVWNHTMNADSQMYQADSVI